MAPLRFLLLLLLASAGLAQEDVELDAADAEEPEVAKSAHLVIRKTVLPTVPVVGSPFEVKLEIFNAGNSDALAVEVHDVAWQGVGAQYLVATPPAAAHGKFAAVPAGGNVTHIYSLIPKAPGYVLGMPASATYRASVDAEARQTVASTGVQVQVISRTSALADKAVMWGTYASLGFLRTREAWRNAALLSAAFGLFLGGTSAKRSVSAAMKRRTARQAEAALLKAE